MGLMRINIIGSRLYPSSFSAPNQISVYQFDLEFGTTGSVGIRVVSPRQPHSIQFSKIKPRSDTQVVSGKGKEHCHALILKQMRSMGIPVWDDVLQEMEPEKLDSFSSFLVS